MVIIVVNAALKYPDIPALVTVGAKKVMSLLALSSSLQLAWLGLGPSFLEDPRSDLVPRGGHLEFYLIRIHQC